MSHHEILESNKKKNSEQKRRKKLQSNGIHTVATIHIHNSYIHVTILTKWLFNFA